MLEEVFMKSGKLLVISAFFAFILTSSLRAADRPTSTSCPFGLASGQVARLNILNASEDQGFIIDWKFLAEDHSVLKSSSEPVAINPGRIASFDLAYDEIPRPGDRTQMRLNIYSLGGPDTFEQNALLSIEIFDRATGRTSIFLGGAQVKGCSNNL